MATLAARTQKTGEKRDYRADQGIFLGLSAALALLTIVGFGQLAARGITDPRNFPLLVHAHALLLLGWLGVFCSQNWLAYQGNLAWHRRLGWPALVLVGAIVLANYHVTIGVIAEGRLHPQASVAFFLALGVVETLTFAGLVGWAIAMRRDTQLHRRLMFGATLMLSAPGINRLVGAPPIPMDLPPSMALSLSIGCQMAFVAILAWHDRRALGNIHKATLAIGLTVLIQRSLPSILPMVGSWVDFANWVTG